MAKATEGGSKKRGPLYKSPSYKEKKSVDEYRALIKKGAENMNPAKVKKEKVVQSRTRKADKMGRYQAKGSK
jgi:hypothetical protein